MSDALRDLYQELVLEHSKRPRNFKTIEGAERAHGHNPLCGDELTVFVRLDPATGVIEDVGFTGSGCAISKASASLMTGAVKGATRERALELFEGVHALVTQGKDAVDLESLGKLAVLSGVVEFPARVKCASLAWHTLRALLSGQAGASTE